MLIAYTKLEDPLSIEIHIHLSMYMLRSTLVTNKVVRPLLMVLTEVMNVL